jgi:hypothetical protein
VTVVLGGWSCWTMAEAELLAGALVDLVLVLATVALEMVAAPVVLMAMFVVLAVLAVLVLASVFPAVPEEFECSASPGHIPARQLRRQRDRSGGHVTTPP